MSSSTTPQRHRSRPLLLGAAVLPMVLIGSVLSASSASAATTVTSKSQLVSAVQSASGGATVVLGNDILGDGGADDVLTLPNARSVTLDLNGNDLDLDRVEIPASSFLTLTDGSNAGAAITVGVASVARTDAGATGVRMARNAGLEVAGGVALGARGSSGRAGIGTLNSVDTNAVLFIDAGATVTATGGSHAAGIGAGEGAVPLSTISITGATVTATAGDGAAAIGGGYAGTGTGSAVSIENGDVTLAGDTAATFSSLENSATNGGTSTVRVAAGSTLTVPAGQTLRNTGDLVVEGRLTGAGTIDNPGGTIRRGDSGVIDDAALTVTGRNHAVTLDAGAGTSTAPAVQHVYAASFTSAGLDLDSYTGSSGGRSLVGWSTGAVAHVASSDPLAPLSSGGGESDPVTLTAAYESAIVFSAGALPNAATGRSYAASAPVAGDVTTFSVAPDTSSGLPADTIPGFPSGLAIDPSTGVITGRAATSGHYSFVLTASSPHQRRSRVITIDVAGAPVIATTALPDAALGTAYAVPVLTTSEHGTITYALTTGALPTGLHLDPATGVVAGTPTSLGTAAFTVAATNAFGTTDRALTLTVVAGTGLTPTGGGSAGGGATSPTGTAGPSGGSGPAPGIGGSGSGPQEGGLVSRPVLPILPTTTVKLGHPLALSIAATTTIPVTYSVPAKDLPAGVSLDRRAGLLFGAPRVCGRFTLHVTATSGAGSSTRTYSLVVPAITRLVTGSAGAVTPRSGGTVLVTIRGLKAGERWRVAVNGRQVQTGVARFGGSVKRSVRLPSRAKDMTHTIRVSGSRRISDPSTTAVHELTVTAVVKKKALRVSRTGSTLTVRGLAAKERVTIRRGATVVATGRADARGVFVTKAAKRGEHVATGSSKLRTGAVVVR